MNSCDGKYSQNHKFLARSKGKQRISKSILRWTTVFWFAPDCLVWVLSSQRCPRCLSCSFSWFFFVFFPLTFVFRVQTAECSLFQPSGGYWLTNKETERPVSSRRFKRSLYFCLCGSLIIDQKAPAMRWRWLVMWNTTGHVQLKRKILVESCWKLGSDMPRAGYSFSLSLSLTHTHMHTRCPWHGWYGLLLQPTHSRVECGLPGPSVADTEMMHSQEMPGSGIDSTEFDFIGVYWFFFFLLHPPPLFFLLVCVCVLGGKKLMVLLRSKAPLFRANQQHSCRSVFSRCPYQFPRRHEWVWIVGFFLFCFPIFCCLCCSRLHIRGLLFIVLGPQPTLGPTPTPEKPRLKRKHSQSSYFLT